MKRILQQSRQTLTLAAPIVMGSAGQILMGVIDSAMIGHVGTIPLAASALANSVFGFFYVVGLGLLRPIPVLVSRTRGSGNQHECAAWLRHGALIAGVYSALSLLLIAALGCRLDLLGAPPEVTREALVFYSLIAVSLVPTLFFQVLRQYTEAHDLPWLSAKILFLGILINVCLNWLLIYGHWGFPSLGLAGAGIATLIARCLICVFLLKTLSRRFGHSSDWPKTIRDWIGNYTRPHFQELLKLGLPSAGQLLFEVCAFTATAIMMGWLGTTALAAHQIALSCISMTFMVPLGIGIAASMRMAHALGSGERERLRPIAFGAMGMAWCAMGCSSLLCASLGSFIARAFTSDLSVVVLAAKLLLVASIFQLFDGTQVVASDTLRSLGDAKVPTLITAIAYWGLAVPTSALLGLNWFGPVGVWSGLAVGLAFAAIALGLRLLKLTRPETA